MLKQNKLFSLPALLLFLVLSIGAQARLRLPALVGDNMVIQRNAAVKLWGWATPGSQVQLVFMEKNYPAVAGTDGRWTGITMTRKTSY